MLRVLFWNVQRKQLDGLVLPLVVAKPCDVLVLIEYPPTSALPALLAAEGFGRRIGSERFGVFAKPSVGMVREAGAATTDRADLWRITPASGDDWLLTVLHGPDRRNAPQDATREFFFRHVASVVREAEVRAGHRRTLLAGDFNANPFEPSVMGANGLHALGVRRVRGGLDRGVRGGARADFFYNPMWRMYGTDPAGDAGAATYYHRDGYEAAEPFWHMLDQVLVRPEFADRVPADQLRILTAAGPIGLIGPDGGPDRRRASDHLPVTFTVV